MKTGTVITGEPVAGQNTQDASSRKSYKQLLMLCLSLVLGGLGVYYSKYYIESQISMYKGQLDTTEPMVELVVPKHPIQRGALLTANDLSVREIPERYADTNSVTSQNFELAIGQRLDFDIDGGRPLLWAHLEGGMSPTFSGKVTDGLRAMTVRVDEINSISGFLQPRDRVDLLLGYGSGKSQIVYPLIHRLAVIATGVQTSVDKASDGSTRHFTTITVHVTPDQAKRIALAQRVGKLTAVLRNPEDESPLSSTPMTVADLLNTGPPAKPVTQRKPGSTRRRTPVIEFIVGGS